MPKNIVVIGPPGTGKTRLGIEISKGWFDAGAAPEEVAYLAFTKAAANVAASRIEEAGVEAGADGKFPYFRTIHSLAYRELKKKRDDVRVVNLADMKLFSAWSSFEGTFAVEEWEDLAEVYRRLKRDGRSEWDDCLTAYTLSRISCTKPTDIEASSTRMSSLAQRTFGRSINEDQYRIFVRKYEDYKRANGLIDFTDMLAFALCEMPPIDCVRHAVVDECQDLAPVLHAIVERVFQGAEEIWWAGDVNQTIFSFAAADAKLFIKRAQEADHRVVLRQTHRFGQEVVDFSTRIIMRAQDRIVVDVKGLPGKMHVLRDTGSFRPMVRPMLILHRHVSGCKALAVKYIAAGMPFRNERGMDPLGADARIKAFTALYDLSEGKDVAAGNVGRLVDDLMPSMLQPEAGQKGIRLLVHGAKKKIQDGFLKGDVRLSDLIQAKIVTEAGANLIQSKTYRAFKHPDDLEYYHRVIQNGHSLHADKIPIITTIHGSKGREAPSVVVFSEMGSKCWDDQDSEHRLAYVAATRTQGELEICAERTVGWAKTKYDYPIEKAIKKQEIDFDA